MKTVKKFNVLALFLLVIMSAMVSCSKKAEPTASVNVLATSNNMSGDVSGNGGSTSRVWKFNNSSTIAGWDMSMNGSSGTFQLVLKDAAGAIKLDKTITAGVGVQSADGTTPAGTAGEWTATITLTNFSGSGDYSFR